MDEFISGGGWEEDVFILHDLNSFQSVFQLFLLDK